MTPGACEVLCAPEPGTRLECGAGALGQCAASAWKVKYSLKIVGRRQGRFADEGPATWRASYGCPCAPPCPTDLFCREKNFATPGSSNSPRPPLHPGYGIIFAGGVPVSMVDCESVRRREANAEEGGRTTSPRGTLLFLLPSTRGPGLESEDHDGTVVPRTHFQAATQPADSTPLTPSPQSRPVRFKGLEKEKHG